MHRWPATRFAAMDDALELLRARGYAPAVIIDCGANTGQWFRIASTVFPSASFHLIEPQPRCVAALERLRQQRADVHIYGTAVSAPHVEAVRMLGGGDGTGTGNYVALPEETDTDEQRIAATTLDALLADRVTRSQRALLKLDVERHEIEVLRGATELLRSVEVVLSETGVYDVAGNRPVFKDLMAFMNARGFEFYDVACLSPRPRDKRLRQMDVMFVRVDSDLVREHRWD
jgi:FkbM family methyltransferase